MKKLITILALILGACNSKPVAQHEYQMDISEVNGVQIVTVWDGSRPVGTCNVHDLQELIIEDNQ